MDPEQVWTLVGVGVASVLGALAALLRRRAKGSGALDPTAEPEQTVVRQDQSTGLEDTGRFMIALQEARPDVLEQFITELRKNNAKEPATRQDLQREVDGVRRDLAGRLETYSRAIEGLRDDVGAIHSSFEELPCQAGHTPTDCPYGGNGGIPQ